MYQPYAFVIADISLIEMIPHRLRLIAKYAYCRIMNPVQENQ